MRKTVCQVRQPEGVSRGRVLARALAEDLKKVQGLARPVTIQAIIQASGTPTDVNSEPDYTWKGSDGDFA